MEAEETCSICGGKMVYIRGRHPGNVKRIVCPTCLAERMDDVRFIISGDYGIAMEPSNGEIKKISL